MLTGRAGGGGPRSLLSLSADAPSWPYAAVYGHCLGFVDGYEAARLVLCVLYGAGTPLSFDKKAKRRVLVRQQRLLWAAFLPAPVAWRRCLTYAVAAADPESSL